MNTADSSESGAARRKSIVRIQLDEKSFLRRRPEVEHEREVALFDILEDNEFALKGEDAQPGPYHLRLSLADDRLVIDVRDTADDPLKRVEMAVRLFRAIIKDYFLVCESYFDAIKTASPSQIEAIDMGRRGLHNEAGEMMQERLSEHIGVDLLTARRFFTLLCVLHMRG